MNLHKYATADEQIAAIVTKLTNVTDAILQKQPQCLVAVSGGKSPIALFDTISRSNFDFTKLCFTLVDERIIEPTHEDSNEHLVRQHLLQNNAKLAKFITIHNHDTAKLQIPDIAILGMGEDGHTASIFPDCSELDLALDLNNPVIYMRTTPATAKYQRITLTLAALVKVPHLILAISGENKLAILEKAGHDCNTNYPISYVLKYRPDLQIFYT